MEWENRRGRSYWILQAQGTDHQLVSLDGDESSRKGERLNADGKSSKGYLADSLMLCHMLDMDIADIEANKPDIFGHVLENYVATELLKQLSYADTKAELLHFRTSDGKEVDFILERPDGTVFAIEVKKSESVNIHDFKGIQAFAALNAKEFTGGIILYAGKEAVPFGKDLWAVPFHVLWQ